MGRVAESGAEWHGVAENGESGVEWQRVTGSSREQ